MQNHSLVITQNTLASSKMPNTSRKCLNPECGNWFNVTKYCSTTPCPKCNTVWSQEGAKDRQKGRMKRWRDFHKNRIDNKEDGSKEKSVEDKEGTDDDLDLEEAKIKEDIWKLASGYKRRLSELYANSAELENKIETLEKELEKELENKIETLEKELEKYKKETEQLSHLQTENTRLVKEVAHLDKKNKDLLCALKDRIIEAMTNF